MMKIMANEGQGLLLGKSSLKSDATSQKNGKMSLTWPGQGDPKRRRNGNKWGISLAV
jgi:hypothetical protein